MKILIAVPCLDMMHTEFVESFMNIHKPDDSAFVFVRNSLTYNSRNLIAQKAIEHEFDRVMWFDSDMVIPYEAIDTLSYDLDRGRDFVTGLYFMRTKPTKPVLYSKVVWNVKKDGLVETGAESYMEYPEGIFEIAGSGFGCVMTSVDLLKKVVDEYGSPFTPLMGIGEDLAFCWRVAKMGMKMYCDSRVKCGHIGTEHFDEDMFLTQ